MVLQRRTIVDNRKGRFAHRSEINQTHQAAPRQPAPSIGPLGQSARGDYSYHEDVSGQTDPLPGKQAPGLPPAHEGWRVGSAGTPINSMHRTQPGQARRRSSHRKRRPARVLCGVHFGDSTLPPRHRHVVCSRLVTHGFSDGPLQTAPPPSLIIFWKATAHGQVKHTGTAAHQTSAVCRTLR